MTPQEEYIRKIRHRKINESSYIKINFNQTKMDIEELVKISKGNPGAIVAAQDIAQRSEETLQQLVDYGIVGTDLYVLYADLCDRDPAQVIALVERLPKELLVDASSRQDRSGRKLISVFFNKNQEDPENETNGHIR